MKRILMALLILIGPMAPVFSANNPSDALAQYKFESGALETDSVGSYTLVETGSVDANATDPQEGSYSAYFDGTNDYYTQGDLTLFSDSNDFTVTCWVLPNDLTGNNGIWNQYNPSGNNRGALMFDDDGQLRVLLGDPTAQMDLIFDAGIDLTVDSWSFLAFTFTDANNGYVWYEYDGSAHWDDGIASGEINASTADFIIGKTYADEKWHGNIDEMIVWNKALTRDEIVEVKDGTYNTTSDDDLVVILNQ